MTPRAVTSMVVQLSWFIFIVAVASAGASGKAPGQGARLESRPVAIDSLGGTDSYRFYCAPCHGVTGTGDGPVALALRVPPTDLTTLAERNGGSFPTARVRAFVTGTGRQIAAHGDSEMPVWGPAFRALDRSERRAQVRIAGIVTHIASLQAKDNGAELYRANCASCHGPSGHGGAEARLGRHAPPDLTKYARRNGGVFPSERLTRIIDGRDIPSHLDREMPVWGTTFMRASKDGSEATVKARIEALVRFLRSIQEQTAE
ncbi:MAG TPA: c-type cytochrome [Vicinamibacterales bacterium]|nr:c-type cytochrome [Vicinamibacterales bacterium]